MKIDVLTLFPAMFAGPLEVSIVQRARTAGRLNLQIHNLRDYARDRHKSVGDKPFGGGPWVVLKPEPLFWAVAGLLAHINPPAFIPLLLRPRVPAPTLTP